MNDKRIRLFDGHDVIDDCKLYKTDVMIYVEGTDELVFRGSNKVIIPGAAFTARAHFNLPNAVEVTPSYNTVLTLENSAIETPTAPEKVYLFAIGTDGSGPEASQLYPVDYKKWIAPESLVPFRYPLSANDISDDLRDTYFGRKADDGSGHIAYYFKAFESEPILVQQYVDGTPIDSSIYTSSKVDDAETYVELRLKVTKEDCREWFIATTGINDARVNTISLLTAWPKVINGVTYYQDIRPLTKLNFTNESLIDVSKGLDIIYHIYY